MPVADPTFDIETPLLSSHRAVIGVDEVGLGAVAGPVTVGMCVLTPTVTQFPHGLRDSKMLSAKKRAELEPLVVEWAPAWAVGHATADEINEHGITECLRTAAQRAYSDLLDQVDLEGAVVLLDGSNNWLKGSRIPHPVTVRPKADRDCVSVAAASVLAKVARDRLMSQFDAEHPGYGWASNKGYGAAAHYEGMRTLGLVEGLHRTAWIRL